MAILKTDHEHLVCLVSKGIEATLHSHIKDKVAEFRNQIVSEIDAALDAACEAAAKDVTARVAMYNDYMQDRVQLVVKFGE